MLDAVSYRQADPVPSRLWACALLASMVNFRRLQMFSSRSFVIVVLFAASPVFAAGCLSGAAVGGVGGHVAGHHALAGAALGCAVGHHMKVKQERKDSAAAQQRAAAASAAGGH